MATLPYSKNNTFWKVGDLNKKSLLFTPILQECIQPVLKDGNVYRQDFSSSIVMGPQKQISGKWVLEEPSGTHWDPSYNSYGESWDMIARNNAAELAGMT